MSAMITAEFNTDDLSVVKCNFLFNGGNLVKTISKDDFVKLINTREEDEKEERRKKAEENKLVSLKRLPKLPEGTVDVEWYDAENFFVSVLVPGQLRPTSYMDSDSERLIPFPNLIFTFRVNRRAMYMSRCFAVKEKRARNVTDETELYAFPYGNVYDDGHICWGTTGIERVIREKGIEGIEYAIETFFNATMNNDLYQKEYTTKKVSLEQLLYEMAEKDTFPSSILVKKNKKYITLLTTTKKAD